MSQEETASGNVTRLLREWSEGDRNAFEELVPVVYEELRTMARRHMHKQNADHTFQTTALIHEAYLKLAGSNENKWANRSHFFGVASKAMRHILVDHARAKSSQKRGGNENIITLVDNEVIPGDRSDDIVALDDALKALAELDERKCSVVEMKFFGGLTIEEIANVLEVSIITVKRDWSFARSWLVKEMS